MKSQRPPAILLLGFGQTAKAVFKAIVPKTKVYATSRDPGRQTELADYGLEPVIMPMPDPEIIELLAKYQNVLVSFPPDGCTDALLAPACRGARCIVYISSTSVYGNYQGRVTDTTPVSANSEHIQKRLTAEEIWRANGATILRAPGIYGPDSGLHLRLSKTSANISSYTSKIVSRIHVDDLAQLVIAVWQKQYRSRMYVTGDLAPASQMEVVSWLCARMGIDKPLPDSGYPPLGNVHGGRDIDAGKVLKDLGISLKYPSYKEGYEACLQACLRKDHRQSLF